MARHKKGPRLVIKDDLFPSPSNPADVSRQVKLQPEDASMYENASWVVAGTLGTDATPWVSYLRRFGGSFRVRVQLDPVAMDVTGHLAFCHGHMPPHVYADWLEERGVDLPQEAFRLLRWRDVAETGDRTKCRGPERGATRPAAGG